MKQSERLAGFTIMELMLAAAVLLISLAALFGAYLGRTHLDETAYNLHRTMHDARRVMEQIRNQNIACGNPSVVSPTGVTSSWDAWLGAGRSLPGAEYVRVTCQNAEGTQYCTSAGATPQVSSGEFGASAAVTGPFDPIRVTVAVGWLQRGRVMGGAAAGPEFTYTPATGVFGAVDANTNGVIDSQSMLTTLITCRPAPPTTAPPTTAAPTSPPTSPPTAPPGT